MAKINLAPTRSNLLKLKASLQFVRDGHDILEKKREVLIMELMSRADEADRRQQEVYACMAEAYGFLELARLTMGQEKIEWAALSVDKSAGIKLLNRGTMGVALSEMTLSSEAPPISYSPEGTSTALDQANVSFRRVLTLLPKMAESEESVHRLVRELKKTQRRVNALERIFIPDYEETIRFIEENLEEQDREEVFKMRFLKEHSTE